MLGSKIYTVATIAVLAAGSDGAAAAHAASLSAADRQFVDSTVTQAMQSQRLPGVTIRISGPKGNYEKTYGVANRSTGAPIRVSDHVRIASITKSFTATAVLAVARYLAR